MDINSPHNNGSVSEVDQSPSFDPESSVSSQEEGQINGHRVREVPSDYRGEKPQGGSVTSSMTSSSDSSLDSHAIAEDSPQLAMLTHARNHRAQADKLRKEAGRTQNAEVASFLVKQASHLEEAAECHHLIAELTAQRDPLGEEGSKQVDHLTAAIHGHEKAVEYYKKARELLPQERVFLEKATLPFTKDHLKEMGKSAYEPVERRLSHPETSNQIKASSLPLTSVRWEEAALFLEKATRHHQEASDLLAQKFRGKGQEGVLVERQIDRLDQAAKLYQTASELMVESINASAKRETENAILFVEKAYQLARKANFH